MDLTELIRQLMEEEGYSVENTFLIEEMLLKTREVSRAKPLRKSYLFPRNKTRPADSQDQ
jgi:hypothetical protein